MMISMDDRPLEERDPELAKRFKMTPDERKEFMKNLEIKEEQLKAEREFKGFRWNGEEWIYHPELDERKKQIASNFFDINSCKTV